jgi:hypothetical protein
MCLCVEGGGREEIIDERKEANIAADKNHTSNNMKRKKNTKLKICIHISSPGLQPHPHAAHHFFQRHKNGQREEKKERRGRKDRGIKEAVIRQWSTTPKCVCVSSLLLVKYIHSLFLFCSIEIARFVENRGMLVRLSIIITKESERESKSYFKCLNGLNSIGPTNPPLEAFKLKVLWKTWPVERDRWNEDTRRIRPD